jgi:hypothetical protein
MLLDTRKKKNMRGLGVGFKIFGYFDPVLKRTGPLRMAIAYKPSDAT